MITENISGYHLGKLLNYLINKSLEKEKQNAKLEYKSKP